MKSVQHFSKNANDTSVNSSKSRKCENKMIGYHLNPDRDNILRSLHLGQNLNVLEIGCSGGILSRYLGDQGYHVTGIKTCQKCLDAARLRCSGLANVTFAADVDDIAAAFTQIYDLILLMLPLPELMASIMNTEETRSATHEVVTCLQILKNRLSETGLLIIATDNRLGLKYWLGAKEEHYGKAYIGLLGYGASAQSPRLFCRNEWLDLLQQAQMPYYRFLYPFPDHQFSDLLLSEDFICTDPNAHSLLYRIRSKDWSTPEWRPEQDEFLYWKSLHKSGLLQDFANSFLIIAAKENDVMEQVFPYDFFRLSKSQQKNIYHTVTYKERNSSFVVKRALEKTEETDHVNEKTITHTTSSHDYICGPLLSELWINSLVIGLRTGEFEKLIFDYYQFLLKIIHQNPSEAEKYLDLVPFNIIVDDNQNYKIFDQEWIFNHKEISAEFILFRALLWFSFAHDIHISCCMAKEKITTLDEFIRFGFQILSLDYQSLQPKFIELEGLVQHSIDPSQGADQIRAVLYQPFQQSVRTYQSSLFRTELFWVTETASLSPDNSMCVQAHIGTVRQTLFFSLPNTIRGLKTLRFDPGDQPGFLHLHRLTLRQSVGKTEEGCILWEAIGSDQIFAMVILENLHYCPSAAGDVFLSTGNDPHIIIELPESISEQSGKCHLMFEAVIDWPKSSDYNAVLDEIRTQRRLLAQMKEEHYAVCRRLDEERTKMEEELKNAAAKRERIVVLEQQLDVLRRTWAVRILKKLQLIPCQL